MPNLSEVLKKKGVKASKGPKKKRNFHAEDFLEIYESAPKKENVKGPKSKMRPLKKQNRTGDLLEEKVLKGDGQGISEFKKKSIKDSSTLKKEKPSQVSPTPSLSENLEVAPDPIKTQGIQKGIHEGTQRGIHLESKSPYPEIRMQYFTLRKAPRKLLDFLIKNADSEGVAYLPTEIITQSLGISGQHLKTILNRLKKNGFLHFERKYASRIYFLNKALLKK